MQHTATHEHLVASVSFAFAPGCRWHINVALPRIRPPREMARLYALGHLVARRPANGHLHLTQWAANGHPALFALMPHSDEMTTGP
jgi:hypothetical protein